MKYIKKFESRYTEKNINKKYYIWTARNNLGILNISKIKKGIIFYEILYRTGGYLDFFNWKFDKIYGFYKISLSYWKRKMITDLLFSTDDFNEALLFYKLKKEGKDVTKDNFKMYQDVTKYNL